MSIFDDKIILATAAAGVVGATALITSSYMWSNHPKIKPIGDISKQSVILPDGSRAAPGHEEEAKLIKSYKGEIRTTYECFQNGLKLSRHCPFLGERTGPNKEYEWMTYQQVHDKAEHIGSGLLQLGIKQGSENFICILCSNRPEWTIIDIGCTMYSIVMAPLYETLGSESSAYIINQTECPLIICEDEEKAKLLLKGDNPIKSVQYIVLVKPTMTDHKELMDLKPNIKFITLSEVETLGENNPREHIPPKPTDLFSLSYTSGSTGTPKGVMISHENIVSVFGAVTDMIAEYNPYTTETVHISYLPLPHAFERINLIAVYTTGGRIGFFQRDIKKLFDDINVLKPTIFPTVPRLLNRIYDKINADVSKSIVKSKLLDWALASKTNEIKQMIVRRDSIWDRLIFKKIQELFGGNVKFMVTGSAPLSDKVLTFFRCALGCLIFEGYGQTEATAVVTMTLPQEYTSGHVGGPLRSSLLKLVDVPESEYYAKDGKGEICVKGPSVTSGYYKLPEKTAEILDKDGWLHTQDIGMWLPNGALKIIDRKKNIFKLAQGEYIAPEKNENIYSQCPLVAQIFVDGHSLQAYTVAIVVPDEEVLFNWTNSEGIKGNFAELCANKDVKAHILKEMLNFGKNGGLKGFEQIRDIYLHSQPFSIENGLLSPTLKSKRIALRKYFAEHVTKLYEVNQ